MSFTGQHFSPKPSDRNIQVFESAFNTYYSGLHVYAAHLTADADTAEDIVCDVFTALWEKQELLHMENLKAYLFSAVRHRALNHLRHLKIRNEYQEQILQQGEVPGTLTWDYYVEGELRERIDQAVARLPEKCRQIFTMNRFENKSIAEIATALEISPRTVETQISIALKKLRADLADYLPAALLTLLLHS